MSMYTQKQILIRVLVFQLVSFALLVWSDISSGQEDISLADQSTIPALTPLGEKFDLSRGLPPEGPLDALISGRITVRSKLRFWWANDDAALASEAHTLGIRAGYLTQSYQGFQAFAEGNHVEQFTPNRFFDGVNSNFDRTFIADAQQSELNQLWAQKTVTGSSFEFNTRIGRQASAAIDERFIGSSSSRQGEQTFDAAAVAMLFGPEKRYSFEYAYIDRVNRLFGLRSLDYESDSHTSRLGLRSERFGNVSFLAILLDLEESAPDLSNQTYGVSIDKRNADRNSIEPVYSIAYAVQSDYGSNTTDYSAASFYLDLGLSIPQFGIISAGYELDTSDNGNAAFQYSLTTGQRIHRLSDKFISTPDDGLNDFFLYRQIFDLPFKSYAELSYHYYASEENERHFGQEFNLITSTPLSENLTLDFLASYFDGSDQDFSDLIFGAMELNLRF